MGALKIEEVRSVAVKAKERFVSCGEGFEPTGGDYVMVPSWWAPGSFEVIAHFECRFTFRVNF